MEWEENMSRTIRFARYLCIMVIACLMSGAAMRAQNFAVYNVNTANFPTITADYIALDPAGNGYTDLKNTDFRVVETAANGAPQDLTATVQQHCRDIVGDPAASILLVVDVSNSMGETVGNKKRIEYVKDAVTAFINRVRFTPNTSVAILGFDGISRLICDWEQRPNVLIDSIKKIQPGTATKYEMCFDGEPNVFAMMRTRPQDVPKFVFFLTDGHPNPLMDKPNEFVKRTSDSANAQGIKIYGITILETTTHPVLQQICDNTGGKAIVTTEDKLVDLYSYLSLETQVRRICTLEWRSPFVCNDQARLRTAVVTLLRGNPSPSATVQYVTPPRSLASVLISDPVLYCGDPAPASSQTATVKITPQNTPFTITSATVTPGTYFSLVSINGNTNPVNMTLPVGVEATIVVRFTQQGMRQFRTAQLMLNGGPCPQAITLVGGTGQVVLSSPNGGEIVSSCDTVTIKWAGVQPTTPVLLQFSEDDGQTWNTIQADVTGLSYKWLPPRPGVRYRVRVSVSATPSYLWATQLGGAGAETAAAVAVTQDGIKVYASGWFDGPSRFGTQVVNNTAGNTDGYFVEMDADGKIVKTTLLTGNGNNDERVIGHVVDRTGNVYVAGYFSSKNALFGSLPLSFAPNDLDTRNMFVFKFRTDGALEWGAYGTGNGLSRCTADASAIGIRYNATGDPEVVVAGRFTGFIRVGINRGTMQYEEVRYNDNNARSYYAIYDKDGYARLTPNAGAPPSFQYSSKRVTDAAGCVYETDSYTGTRTFAGASTITLPNNGLTDVFVSKFCAAPASQDASDSSFKVLAPELSFSSPSVTMDPTAQGQSSSKAFTALLCNTGDYPVVVSTATVGGPNGGDFRVVGELRNVRLAPGQCIAIEFEFKPTGTGMRTGTLTVEGTCNTVAQLVLEGNGLAPCTWKVQEVADLGKTIIGTPLTITGVCLLRNDSPTPLSGTLSVAPGGEFVVTPSGPFNIPPGGCLTADITFTPVVGTSGVRSAVISYSLPTECGTPITDLRAQILAPELSISNVDFGLRRLLTVNNDVIVIRNLSSDPATITSLTPSDPNNPHLKLTLPGTPRTLQPGDTLPIPVRYEPQDRNSHVVTVTAAVAGQSTPLVGEAKGKGYLPVIDPKGYTFGPWTVLQQSPEIGTVVIGNSDAESPLTIYSVDFATSQADFTWVSPPPSSAVTIQPNGTPLTLQVRFTPQAEGIRTVSVCIMHDGKPGPDDMPPYAQSCVDVTGVGTKPSDLPPVDFGDVLTCATKTVSTIVIQNPNPQFPLVCQAPVATGDVANFSLSEMGAFIVPAGGSRTLELVFSPTAVMTYNVSYSIPNDQGLGLNINATGRGVRTPIDLRFGTIPSGIVGQAVPTPVRVTFPDLDTVRITDVTVRFTYPARYMRFNGTFINPQQTGWTFSPDQSVPGELTVRATAAPGTYLQNGDFMTPMFDVFLNIDSTLPITADLATNLSCLIPSGDSGEIEMKRVCFTAGRLVRFGAQQFGLMAPYPSPAQDMVSVTYTTGIELATMFEVVDGMGNIVRTITTDVGPSAEYSLDIDTRDLANGIYYLRMLSGPYTATRVFTVVK